MSNTSRCPHPDHRRSHRGRKFSFRAASDPARRRRGSHRGAARMQVARRVWRSAARSISIWKRSAPSRGSTKSAASSSIPRRSIPARRRKWWRACWAFPAIEVTVECLRMGGAFGGKEVQANPWAAIAALGAWKTKRPVRVRLPRHLDMALTGQTASFPGALLRRVRRRWPLARRGTLALLRRRLEPGSFRAACCGARCFIAITRI